ncbi:tetratricopeptide repeat protein [Chryseobacterium cucumeris]|uniref:tetratricopeptide repeat protein n=1 Tax=Chryseobacterium cucumeris TaxID=1813611 RepID=UPI0024570E83|nr:hypothetical protein [Chryseobacterium cucumeris]MDH5034376.1 hypothetical protein [Chryseobacterium cucumeris]
MRTLILLIFFTFAVHNCKDYKREKIESKKTIIHEELTFSPVTEIKKDFTLQGKSYKYEYKFDKNIIRIAAKNYDGGFYNEVYSNNSLIGKLQKNSWSCTPYYYKNKNLGLLFIEEGDESGIWGYSIFLVKEKEIKEVGFIDISSTQDSPLNKFLSFTQENNFIIFNFLEPQFFSNQKTINKSDQTVKIDLSTLKIIKSSNNNTNSNIAFSLKDYNYTINFTTKSIVPKTDDVYFENNFLVIKKTAEENTPHNLLTYKYYFVSASNTVQLSKINFSKETYVEQDDICKLSYTYLPNNDSTFSPEEINTFTEKDLDMYIRKLDLKQALDIVSKINKDYQCTSSLTENEINQLLKQYPLNEKIVNDYNNIAYYQEQNKDYKSSISILDKILSQYPDRVVAWLNYADAKWGLNNKQESKEAYIKYFNLMNSQSKDMSRVPQRVRDRMK